jgi:tetratricopeptide (TPR) repeat protein
MYSDKSIYLCHRRANSGVMAQALYHLLSARGYQVFYDTQLIDTGRLDPLLLNQMAARGYCVILLSHGGVERLNEQRDWMRREMEFALDTARTLLLVQLDDFAFEGMERFFKGKLEALLQLPASQCYRLTHEKFDEQAPALLDALAALPPAPRSNVPNTQMLTVSARLLEMRDKPAPAKKIIAAEAYLDRALTHRRMGDYQAALNNIQQALKLNPDYMLAYVQRGNLHCDLGDRAQGMADYARAIALRPDYPGTYNNRAVEAMAAGELEAAIADFNIAIQLNPDYEKPYLNRGEAYFAKGDHPQALANFSKCNDLRPGYFAALAGMAIAHHALGQREDAVRLWGLLLGLNKRYRDPNWFQKQLHWDDILMRQAQALLADLPPDAG